MKTYLYLIAVVLLVGCRGAVHRVGTIGVYSVYSVKLPSAAGPSINIALIQGDTNSTPIVLGVGAGNGVSTTALQAGAIAGAAALIRPSTIENNYNQPTSTPDMIGPPLPPTTIGNDKNTNPFTHRK